MWTASRSASAYCYNNHGEIDTNMEYVYNLPANPIGEGIEAKEDEVQALGVQGNHLPPDCPKQTP